MNKQDIEILIDKLIANEISLVELDQLISLIDDPEYAEGLARIIDEVFLAYDVADVDPQVYRELQERIDKKVLAIPKKSTKKVFLPRMWRWVGAACLTMVLSMFFYEYFDIQYFRGFYVVQEQLDKGIDETYISFGDAKTIRLDSMSVGQQIVNNGLIVKKIGNNEVVYESALNVNDDIEPFLVSIVTSAKDDYRVTLPDGTKAWLNAQSNLSFPSKFVESQRKVQMKGELYFEVTPAIAAANKSFVVECDDQTITVLGTAFNINAYKRKNQIITSLVEGKVELSSKGSTIILYPGQQSVLPTGKTDFIVRSFNTEEVLAWRDGYFIFNDTPLANVLEDLSQWYGFEMSELSQKHMESTVTAKINRNIALSSVLKSMEKFTPYVFNLEGNKLIMKDK